MLSSFILTAALAVPGADPTPSNTNPAPSAMPGMSAAPLESLAPLPADQVFMPGAEPSATDCLTDTHLGHPDRFWGGVNYLRYWYKNGPNPVTLLNSGGNRVLGGTDYDYGAANGIGFNAGGWLDNRHTYGVQFGGFLMEQRSVFGAQQSNAAGFPALTRPYTDALRGIPAVSAVSTPNASVGNMAVASGLRFAGAEALGVRNLTYCPRFSVDALAGVKYLDLDEFLDVTQVTQPINGGQLFFNRNQIPANTGVTINDRFRTRNQFWGGVVGLRGEYFLGPVFLNGTVKVGMGNNQQVVDIDGSSRVNAPNGAAVAGGLLAGPGANIGSSVTNRFAIVNELGCQLGMQVTSHAKVLVGYDFIYLNNVVRPGQQIDPVINNRFVPTSAAFGSLAGLRSPVVTGTRDDFFAHGVRFGLELRY
jgi:hypothetical protein